MIKINNRELKKKVGTLKKWCLKEGLNYNSFINRASVGVKDKILEKIIRSGADLNEVLEIDDNL